MSGGLNKYKWKDFSPASKGKIYSLDVAVWLPSTFSHTATNFRENA